jgi:hypothetical protein
MAELPATTTDSPILGFVRHILTMGGGVLITKGVLDETTLSQLVGAAMTFIGFAWSYWAKKSA